MDMQYRDRLQASVRPRNFGELPHLTARIDEHEAKYRSSHIVVGSVPDADAVNLTSGDYLSLANDQRLVDAQIAAVQDGQTDVFMSGVYSQFMQSQSNFQREVAVFLDADDAVLCQSGYAANDGLIQCLADEETPVYIDAQGDPSLRQGAHHAGATVRSFAHDDVADLRAQMARYGPGIVAVDAINGFFGSVCPLADIVEVAEQGDSVLVVHESHSMGVCGPRGKGLVSSLGLVDRVPFRTFSLSQAFVSRGAMIVGPAEALDFFRYDSLPAIFSSAVLPFEIARFSKVLEIVQQEQWRRDRLAAVGARLRDRLSEFGYRFEGADTHILALSVDTEEQARTLRDSLEKAGIFGSLLCAPALAEGQFVIRLKLHVGLSEGQLDTITAALGEVRKQLERLE